MKRINGKTIAIAVVSLVVLVGALVVFMGQTNESPTPAATITPATAQEAQTTTAAGPSTEDLLLYLIEEEKLAHDVYTVMYQKYSASVFGNILQSEATHQGKVLVLLQARNIADPRSPEVGVFKNQDLQALYNQLIEQGNINATEAYKAGVAIEEKDIADIGNQLATATDQDVIAALEFLRSGSENHLRAFNKQL